LSCQFAKGIVVVIKESVAVEFLLSHDFLDLPGIRPRMGRDRSISRCNVSGHEHDCG
jgi:hypothetical protein